MTLPGSAWLTLPALAVALWLLLAAGLFLGQRQILFRPDRTAPDLAGIALPGLAATRLPTADGLSLLAWTLPSAPGAPVILYLHGNAGHIGYRGERFRAIAAQGWGAMIPEYRGYGGNPGQPSEAGLRQDAAAALAALHAQGIAPGRIVLWGESLGSGLAAWLAARHPVGAVVLETPYTSIAAIAKQRYPFIPVDTLLKDRFDSLAELPVIAAPILVAVAGRDRVVPPAMGQDLHAAARAPAELWLAPEAGHSDLRQHGLVEAIAAFLARHLKP
jgi:fermentation-respiration switch protein FrsA (DUF1100 family)